MPRHGLTRRVNRVRALHKEYVDALKDLESSEAPGESCYIRRHVVEIVAEYNEQRRFVGLWSCSKVQDLPKSLPIPAAGI